MAFTSHQPQGIAAHTTVMPQQESGKPGIGELALAAGVGAFTGNWIPLATSVLGGIGGEAVGAIQGSSSKAKSTGGSGSSEDPTQPTTIGGDTGSQLGELTSEKMTPDVGQPLNMGENPQLTNMFYTEPRNYRPEGQGSLQSQQQMAQQPMQPQYFSDPMRWYT
jgi:hypothetical protein